MSDESCGCCEGIESLTPLPTANRPGLTALAYRVGTHATFLETMMARLSSLYLELPTAEGSEERKRIRPLAALTTRESEDPSIALLDAWAVVGDVLTFYQERIANEGYLLTATERRSILELAKLVGYTLRPGVASTVYLAFTLEKDLDQSDYDVVVPSGTRARNIPEAGELPQAFETVEDLRARTSWNAIRPRLRRPHYLPETPDGLTDDRLYLSGISTNLKANDAFLLVYGTPTPLPFQVLTVETVAEEDHTVVTYRPFGAEAATAAPGPPAGRVDPRAVSIDESTPLERIANLLDPLKLDPSVPPAGRFQLARPPDQAYGAGADIGPQLLVNLHPILKDSLYAAYKDATITAAPALDSVEALRVKAAPFGHIAPLDLVYDDNGALVGRREWPLAEVGTKLDVRLLSDDPDEPRAAELFDPIYNLGDDEFPLLRLEISISDSAETDILPPIRLSELEEVSEPGAGEPLYETTRTIRELTVTVRAQYEEEGTDQWMLRNITVGFSGQTQTHSMAIRRQAPVAINGDSASGLRITIDSDGTRTVLEGGQLGYKINGRVVTIVLDQTLEVSHFTPRFVREIQFRVLSLDATYDDIAPGSWVLIDRPDRSAPIITRAVRVRTVSRTDYGISGQVTQLVLADPWLTASDTTLALLRGTMIHTRSVPVKLSEVPLTSDIEGDLIELDGLHDGLEAGRWLVVSGERADLVQADGESVAGVEASELVMLAGLVHDVHRLSAESVLEDGTVETRKTELPGDRLHTTLILAEPLAYTYKRDTITVNANVAKATHGETREEVLGSGDGSEALQEFELKQSPLTFVAAPTPAGAESTLEVRVNDVEWREASSLVRLEQNSRGFVTKTDNDGKTTVIFGDGRHGARLPTGVENVEAEYRSGIGKSGNVDAGSISQLATRPLGVKEVVNPVSATGGADPESRDQARRNAPLAVMALDRLVSVKDYADFARTFAGIAKADAVRLSDGRRRPVHLTIAGLDDIPISSGSDLYRNLREALHRFGDPHQPIQVAVREVLFLFIRARVGVLPDHRWETVEPEIRAKLLDTFSFERRELGQDVQLSEVFSAVQAVRGVSYVDVDLLDVVSENVDLEDLADLADTLELHDRIPVNTAWVDRDLTDPAERIRPAQLAYLNPNVPDTLILTEVTA